MARCPTPSKTAYDDELLARVAAVRIRADQRGPALAPYPCPCGSVHLHDPTKPNQSLTVRIRTALKATP